MMPMFHQGGRASTLLGFSEGVFTRQSGGFTYNDSPYIHALNRTLQLEQAAVSLYSAHLRMQLEENSEIAQRSSCHHYAHRQLVRMIFAQRGLPDSNPVSFTAVTTTFAAKAARWMPRPVHSPVLGASSQRLEGALQRRYAALIQIAPATDLETLLELHEQTRDFCSQSL